MALRTQGCTLGYRIWPPWGFLPSLGNGGPIMSFPRYPKYKASGVELLRDRLHRAISAAREQATLPNPEGENA